MEYKLDIKNPIVNSDIYIVKQRLCALGYIKKVNDYIFDIELEKAIKKFQADNNLEIDGVITESLLNYLFKEVKVSREVNLSKTSSIVARDKENDTSDYEVPTLEDSYFSDENSNLLKKSNLEITIKYAGANKKILKNVTLYNKDQVIDSNGEPIYDIYQFVARDLED